MRTRYSTISMFKTFLLLFIILLGLIVFSSCRAGTGAVPRGWSGGVIDNDILFIGSMEGKLAAANTTDGSLLWTPVPLEAEESTGGGFGCAPASTAIAIYGSPAVEGDLVYVAGYNGKVYAISASTRLSTEESLRKNENSLPQPIIGGPVIAQGRVYVGSSDGWVYALRAADGALAWRYRAAPDDRRLVAYGQCESVWPVHGSVLIEDNRVYFAAGRYSHLDGGVICSVLDLHTGQTIAEQRHYSRDAKTGKVNSG